MIYIKFVTCKYIRDFTIVSPAVFIIRAACSFFVTLFMRYSFRVEGTGVPPRSRIGVSWRYTLTSCSLKAIFTLLYFFARSSCAMFLTPFANNSTLLFRNRIMYQCNYPFNNTPNDNRGKGSSVQRAY